MHILRTDLYVLRLAERFRHFRDGGERRNDDDFDIGDVAEVDEQRLNECSRLGLRHVHLPIGGYDFLSHESINHGDHEGHEGWRKSNTNLRALRGYLSVKAATPGSSLPSSSSSDATPPVEINV